MGRNKTSKELDKIFDDGEVDINDYLDLSSANKPSKELVNLKIAYEQGLLSGFTKSIVLIRHLQRSLSPHTDTGSQIKILEEAMELISQEIKENNE
jgi:hypothetical protein